MAFVHNGITLDPRKAWTHQDGRQFPARFILDVDISTRESVGVSLVDDVAPIVYDQEYYYSPGVGKDLDDLKKQICKAIPRYTPYQNLINLGR